MTDKYDVIYSMEKVFLLGSLRSGSTFIQSLLDGHSNVFIFPNILRIHDIWSDGREKDLELFIKEWFKTKTAKEKIHKKSADLVRSKKYQTHLLSILKKRPLNRKNFFIAIYQAYAEVENIDLSKKKILVEHTHTTFCIDSILEDFPNARFVFPVRDPRACYSSSIKIEEGKGKNTEYWRLKIMLHAYHNVIYYTNWLKKEKYFVLRNEDLIEEKEKKVREFAEWLGIQFKEKMLQPTLNGNPWKGNSAYKKSTDYAQPRKKWTEYLLPKTKDMMLFLSNEYMQINSYIDDGIKRKNESQFREWCKGIFALITSSQAQRSAFQGREQEEWLNFVKSVIAAPCYRIFLYLLYGIIFPHIRKIHEDPVFKKPYFKAQVKEMIRFFL